MRYIKLEAVRDPEKPNELPLSYKSAIANVISTPRNPQGFSNEELVKGIPINIMLKKHEDGDTLALENDEWDFVVNKLTAFDRWGLLDQRILDMIDAVKNAPKELAGSSRTPTPINREERRSRRKPAVSTGA